MESTGRRASPEQGNRFHLLTGEATKSPCKGVGARKEQRRSPAVTHYVSGPAMATTEAKARSSGRMEEGMTPPPPNLPHFLWPPTVSRLPPQILAPIVTVSHEDNWRGVTRFGKHV